jgi:hypothetical protein
MKVGSVYQVILPGKEERYRLVGKKIYCHGDSGSCNMPFWDGAGIEWHKWWDLGYAKLIVVGGDGPRVRGDEWIDKGTDELGFSVRQLDAFHLARSCRRGWENGDDMYAAIRCGRVRRTLGEVKEREGKTAQKARSYVLKRLDKGADWREKVEEILDTIPDIDISEILDGTRGLGVIGGNESNPGVRGDRMKDRGMSWTISGAVHMGKGIQLVFNGELAKWCGREPPDSGVRKSTLSFDLFDELDGYGKRTAIPALEGSHASRPWDRILRNMTSAYDPLN